MQELRWNPLLGTYTMVAANRQARPHLPKGDCPFCPGSGKVPDNYDVLAYDNDFPALSLSPPDIMPHDGLYSNKKAFGKCEVILYTPDHNSCMSQLSEEKIKKVIELLAERTRALSQNPKIKYIFPFENRGKEVGVTMHHPHGQLYAYSFIPLKIKTELDNCKAYYTEKGANLFDDMNSEELAFGKRMVYQNDSFLGYIPYFTDYPYGIFIVARNNRGKLTELNDVETADLSDILKKVTQGLDGIFNKPMPYMMCFHQSPANSEEYENTNNYYRFHIEFYPALREKDKIKWYASSEMGAWAALNPLTVEDCAAELKSIINNL